MDWKAIVGTIVTSLILSLGASYLSLRQAEVSSSPDTMVALFNRITALEAETARLQVLYFEAKTENNILKMQLDASVSTSPRGTIVNYLNSLRARPAWCKEYHHETDSFTMLHINSAYENFYGITLARYKDQPDYVIHGDTLGRQYEANDKIALEVKGFQEFIENIDVRGQRLSHTFWKFFVPLPDSTELICGIQVSV